MREDDKASHRYQHKNKEGEVVKMDDGCGDEERWRSRRENRQVDEKRKRSSSREDFVSSSSRIEMDGGYRKVYISWDRLVSKGFLHVHFSRFGEVEFIWMSGDYFFGFVTFIREEVGRSLVGACHNVEGVKISIIKARPDWKLRDRERRDVQTCAFFKEGLCLRHGHCQFLHSVEPTSSRRSRERSGSRERARREEMSTSEQRVRRGTDVNSKLTEKKKESRKSRYLLEEESSERDGRLRPPPSSLQEKVKVVEISPFPVSAKVSNMQGNLKEKMGDVEERTRKGAKREMRTNELKVNAENMNPEAMMERIRQLEETLKEKEEAEDRRKRFLKAGAADRHSKMKDEEAQSSGQSSRGSRRNCHLVKSLAKKFKRVENE